MKIFNEINFDNKKWKDKNFFCRELEKNQFLRQNNISDIKKLVELISLNIFEYFNVYHKRDEIHISYLLTNNQVIHDINFKFRNKNNPTNVLSFEMTSKEEQSIILDSKIIDKSVFYLGEIIISFEKILEESIDLNINFIDHFCHILTHGILHLLGFDHETSDEDAEKMEFIEKELMNKINIPNPYKIFS